MTSVKFFLETYTQSISHSKFEIYEDIEVATKVNWIIEKFIWLLGFCYKSTYWYLNVLSQSI